MRGVVGAPEEGTLVEMRCGRRGCCGFRCTASTCIGVAVIVVASHHPMDIVRGFLSFVGVIVGRFMAITTRNNYLIFACGSDSTTSLHRRLWHCGLSPLLSRFLLFRFLRCRFTISGRFLLRKGVKNAKISKNIIFGRWGRRFLSRYAEAAVTATHQRPPPLYRSAEGRAKELQRLVSGAVPSATTACRQMVVRVVMGMGIHLRRRGMRMMTSTPVLLRVLLIWRMGRHWRPLNGSEDRRAISAAVAAVPLPYNDIAAAHPIAAAAEM